MNLNICAATPRYTGKYGETIVKLEGYDNSKQAKLTRKFLDGTATYKDSEKLKNLEAANGYLYDMSPNL